MENQNDAARAAVEGEAHDCEGYFVRVLDGPEICGV